MTVILQAPGHAAVLSPLVLFSLPRPGLAQLLLVGDDGWVAVPSKLKPTAAMQFSSRRQQQAFWLGACCLLGWGLLCNGAAPGTAAAGAAAGAAEEQVSDAMTVAMRLPTPGSVHALGCSGPGPHASAEPCSSGVLPSQLGVCYVGTAKHFISVSQ